MRDICYHWYYRYYHDIGEEWYTTNVVVVLMAYYDLSELSFGSTEDTILYRTDLFCIFYQTTLSFFLHVDFRYGEVVDDTLPLASPNMQQWTYDITDTARLDFCMMMMMMMG